MSHSIVKTAVGILAGAGIGFGYYKLVGCSTGSCPLTSNPLITTLYGALMGGLMAWG